MAKYSIKYTSQFRKQYKLAKKRGKDISKLEYVIDALANGEQLDGKYLDHSLKMKF